MSTRALSSLLTLFVLAGLPALASAPAAAEGSPVAPPDPCSTHSWELNPAPMSFTPATPADGLDGTLLAKPPFQKTCRCSCGYPCQTNEDCGPGGICGAGITCCASPWQPEPPAVEVPGETPPVAVGVVS